MAGNNASTNHYESHLWHHIADLARYTRLANVYNSEAIEFRVIAS